MIRLLTVAGLIAVGSTAAAAPQQFVTKKSAYLGVELLSITPELRTHYGSDAKRGVLLSRLDEEGPAAAGGLAVGDVLLSIDRRDLTRFSDAVLLLASKSPGDTVVIEYIRKGEKRSTEFKLGEKKAHRVQFGPFRWRGPTPLIDPGALNESMQRLQEELRGMDSRRVIRLQRERRGLEERLRLLEGKLKELEQRLGEDA